MVVSNHEEIKNLKECIVIELSASEVIYLLRGDVIGDGTSPSNIIIKMKCDG